MILREHRCWNVGFGRLWIVNGVSTSTAAEDMAITSRLDQYFLGIAFSSPIPDWASFLEPSISRASETCSDPCKPDRVSYNTSFPRYRPHA